MDIGKQAISPLFATILLVAFSVGLGAVVMTWGEEYVAEKAEFVQGAREAISACDSASFNLINVGGAPQICYRKNVLELSIDNGPDMEIFDFHARLLGTAGAHTDESILNAPLKKLHAAKASVTFQNIGTLKQVKLVPKVSVLGDIIFCKDKSMTVENISACL